MKKISSHLTFVHKRIVPLILLGFLGVISIPTAKEDAAFIVFPGLLAIFGFWVMRKLVWDLADEVYDCGTHLLVRNRGDEESVSLSNVTTVRASLWARPPRVTLRLIAPSKFGSEISFYPVDPFALNPPAKNAVVEELILRVEQERSERAV